MGWRDAVEQVVRDCCLCGSDAEIDAMARTVATLLSAMPPADCLALARELLPEGWVVARDVGEIPNDEWGGVSRAGGWNACRAAMMGEGE